MNLISPCLQTFQTIAGFPLKPRWQCVVCRAECAVIPWVQMNASFIALAPYRALIRWAQCCSESRLFSGSNQSKTDFAYVGHYVVDAFGN